MSDIPPMPRTILIVEDEVIFRNLLKNHLEHAYHPCEVLEACDGEKGWELFRQHCPRYCIVDLRLPKLRGEILINLMQSHHDRPRILILTGQPMYQLPAIIKPSTDLLCVDKAAFFEQLNEALDLMFAPGENLSDRFRVDQKQTPDNSALSSLTKREEVILGMLGDGKTTESISHLLGISIYTVRTHRRNLMKKLGIHSCGPLVRCALEYGLSAKIK